MNDTALIPTDDLKSPRHLFYVLRLWKTEGLHGSDWRASLENAETGNRIGFASLEQLFGYLMDLSDGNRDVQTAENKK
jgi:hypothetical protein